MANLDGGPVIRFFRKLFSVRLGYDGSAASTPNYDIEHPWPDVPSALPKDYPGSSRAED